MKDLIKSAKDVSNFNQNIPFSVYSSVKEQHIFNVPIIKPLLIFILGGSKVLGGEMICKKNTFIFLSNTPNIEMRNIPDHEDYFAILIEFEYDDFDQFKRKENSNKKHIHGDIDSTLEKTLKQYIDYAEFSIAETWHHRRKELLQIIYLLGYQEVSSIAAHPSVGHQLFNIIKENIVDDVGSRALAKRLLMSESTLRRKLKLEGTSVKEIKNRAKLGHGLHLIQTTMDPIGIIANNCGYDSQSRFTDKFKQMFGLTPSSLRKTRF